MNDMEEIRAQLDRIERHVTPPERSPMWLNLLAIPVSLAIWGGIIVLGVYISNLFG